MAIKYNMASCLCKDYFRVGFGCFQRYPYAAFRRNEND